MASFEYRVYSNSFLVGSQRLEKWKEPHEVWTCKRASLVRTPCHVILAVSTNLQGEIVSRERSEEDNAINVVKQGNPETRRRLRYQHEGTD